MNNCVQGGYFFSLIEKIFYRVDILEIITYGLYIYIFDGILIFWYHSRSELSSFGMDNVRVYGCYFRVYMSMGSAVRAVDIEMDLIFRRLTDSKRVLIYLFIATLTYILYYSSFDDSFEYRVDHVLVK
jgi:hypothetical protein